MYIIEVVQCRLLQGIFYKHTSKYSVRFNTISFHPEDSEFAVLSSKVDTTLIKKKTTDS